MAGAEEDYYAFEVRVVGNNTNTTPPMLVPFSEARSRNDLWDETVARIPFYRDHRFLAAQAGQDVSPPTFLLQETSSTTHHETEHVRWKTVNWDEAVEYSRWFTSNVVDGEARRLKIEVHFFTADKLPQYWPWYDWITNVGRDFERMNDTSLKEIPFDADIENLKDLKVVAGTDKWFPERQIDYLAASGGCQRCEAKAVE